MTITDLAKVPVRRTTLGIGYVVLDDVPLQWREKCANACAAARGKVIVPNAGESVFEGDWHRWLSSIGVSSVNLGVNSASISYEVALEVLGQSRQPFMTAIREESAKVSPSTPFIRYCEARLNAIDDLQDELVPTDHDTIERILARDGQPNFFKT
jgi:hypothetical protein